MFSIGNNKIGSIYLGNTKISKAYLGNELVYSAAKPAKQVGDIVDWAGYTWIVVNDNGDGTIVLAMQDIYELTQFGSNSTYAGSTLASRALAFENSLPASALAQAVNTTVNGVTAKVFVASKELAYGGYSYFYNNNSRIAKYNGTGKEWWTSSKLNDTKVYFVETDGKINSVYDYIHAGGFRPFITVNQF